MKGDFKTIMKYQLVKENFKSPELGEYTSYGIISDSGFKISDISLEKAEVEALILKINEKQTPICYLPFEIDSFFSKI